MLYSAFEAIDIVRRAAMKFLQTVRTSAKVKDAARVLVADSMRCWFFSQAYRTDFQGFSLSEVTLWLLNEEVAATGTAEEIFDVPIPERERRNRADSESDQ
jgi:hypothetical protein